MTQEVVPPYGAPQFQPPPPLPPPLPSPPPVTFVAGPPAPPLALPPPVVPGTAYPAPPPSAAQGAGVRAGAPQRPAVVALACTLTVVASLQWICGLSLLWVAAAAGTSAFSQVGDNGAVFHILNRFEDRMMDGLAVPLYLFPLASFVAGFLVLRPRPWARLLHTGLGAAALAWAAWWLRDDLLWWFSAAWYVVVACLVLWTPAATAWYRPPEGADAA